MSFNKEEMRIKYPKCPKCASLEDQIDKLADYIVEYFPGNIIDEGACLTAIAIMEELRNK